MEVVTWLTELAVGVACLVVAWTTRTRTGSMRVAGVFLLVAGLAAVGHASWALVTC